MWKVLLCLAIALGPRVAAADDDEAAMRELVTALRKRDAATVGQHVRGTLRLVDLWFGSASCRKFAGPNVAVARTELKAAVACIAKLGVKERGGMLTYGPGIPLTLDTDGARLVAIRSIALDPDSVTIEPQAFTARLKNFRRELAPDAETRRAVDARSSLLLYAQLVACIDRKGKIDKLEVADASAVFPEYAERAARAAREWRGTPVVVGGKRVRACTTVYVGYPGSRLAFIDMPPPSPPPTRIERTVTAQQLEEHRTHGSSQIAPDAMTVEELAQVGARAVTGTWWVCVGRDGAVDTTRMLRGTGFGSFDLTIERAIDGWAFEPWSGGGSGMVLCSTVSVSYDVDKVERARARQ